LEQTNQQDCTSNNDDAHFIHYVTQQRNQRASDENAYEQEQSARRPGIVVTEKQHYAFLSLPTTIRRATRFGCAAGGTC